MKEKANFTPSSLLYSVWPLKAAAAAFASTALVDSYRVGDRSETFPYSLTSRVSFLPLSLKIDAAQNADAKVWLATLLKGNSFSAHFFDCSPAFVTIWLGSYFKCGGTGDITMYFQSRNCLQKLI